MLLLLGCFLISVTVCFSFSFFLNRLLNGFFAFASCPFASLEASEEEQPTAEELTRSFSSQFPPTPKNHNTQIYVRSMHKPHRLQLIVASW